MTLLPLLISKCSPVLLPIPYESSTSSLIRHPSSTFLQVEVTTYFNFFIELSGLFVSSNRQNAFLGTRPPGYVNPAFPAHSGLRDFILTTVTVNPFSKKESRSPKEVITYKVLTILSWLLSVVVSVYYSTHSPAHDYLTIPGQNLLHPSGFTLNFGLVYFYL